jgi:hypothetical protein
VLRLFVVLNLLLISLLACKGGYQSCQQKLIDSDSIVDNSIKIPISKNTSLIYSQKISNSKIIKSDPFLNLYIVKSDNKFNFPFRINYFLSPGCAAIDKKTAEEGEVLSDQIGLNHLAKFTKISLDPKLLVNSCCALEGIVTKNGIIQKEYIDRFIKTKDVRYADIGIRIDYKNKLPLVKRVNPFIENNMFKKDDLIISLNGKKVTSSAKFMRDILFSKIGITHTIKVKRGSKVLTLSAKTYERLGGGVISDTFLESKGLYFSKDMKLLKVSDAFSKYGLKIGDKLIKIDSSVISGYDDLSDNLISFEKKSSLLFERNGFQFFVNIN